MGDKTTCKKNLKIVAIVLLVVSVLSGFIVCSVFHFLQCKSTDEPCTECYNGGNLFQKTKTCTCAEGYGGQCCEFKTQMCQIGQWTEWSHCSKDCGQGGIQFRIRENVCDLQNCSQQTYEQRACNIYCYNGGIPSNVSDECICQSGYGGECCECEIQDCEMTPWIEWSVCTRTCGPQGTRFRTRNVAKASLCGGAQCPVIFTEEEECNRVCYNNGTLDVAGDKCTCPDGYNGQCCECKIQDCVMTPWNDWSTCSHACGPRGMTFRMRNVHTAPMCGGIECSRNVSEQKPCNRMCENEGILDDDAGECSCTDGFSGHCCNCENVDCELSNWTEWSTCENATRQVRSRDVRKYPKCAGHACEGSLTEDRSCEIALKHKLLLPKWSVAVLGVYGAVLTLGLVSIMIIYCIISRRKRIALDKSCNSDMNAVKAMPPDMFTNLPPLPEKQDN